MWRSGGALKGVNLPQGLPIQVIPAICDMAEGHVVFMKLGKRLRSGGHTKGTILIYYRG